MARTKKVDTTAIASENEVMAETAEIKLEGPAEVEETPAEPVKEAVKKAPVNLEKNSKVWIQNLSCAYKRVRVLVEVYPFDSEGKALVNAEDAEKFLTLPGYSIVK